MAYELSGKVAIITGGAGGIGRAIAELFVAEGAKVVVGDVDAEHGEELADELGEAAAFKETDVADPDAVQGLVDFAVGRFGGLHVMCNNAGVTSSFRRFLKNDLSELERVMAVNLYGVVVGTQRAARHMADNAGGSIVNTSSIGALTGGAHPIVYRMSKAAVIQFTRSVAVDLAEHAVRVNCIAPGHIATGITNYDLDPVITYTQPLQRRGQPSDVAEAALFLAGDRSVQITGTVLPVDGGTTAGPPLSQVKLLMSQGKGERDAR